MPCNKINEIKELERSLGLILIKVVFHLVYYSIEILQPLAQVTNPGNSTWKWTRTDNIILGVKTT